MIAAATHTLHTTTHSRQNGVNRIHGDFSFLRNLIPTDLVGNLDVNYTRLFRFVNTFWKNHLKIK